MQALQRRVGDDGFSRRASTGADLPQLVKDEFDTFLAYGILAHGLLRLRCGDCGHHKMVAFSCKQATRCPANRKPQRGR